MELYDIPLTITCDLGKNTVSPQVISINQNEANVKKLRVEFVSGGKPWEIPAGFSCNILMKKADGFGVDNPAESISGNAAVFNITPQMSVAVGENRFQIQIIKNEDDVRGFVAVLSVQRAALSNDEIISESELKTVEETIRDETNKWLDEHPEATTTVLDGSLEKVKFSDLLYFKVGNFYSNLQAMLSDNTLKVGEKCVISGFYEPEDGGGGEYVISDTAGDVSHQTSTGLYANLSHGNTLNALQIGCKGDGVFDNTDIINQYTQIANLYFPAGLYMCRALYFRYSIFGDCGNQIGSGSLRYNSTLKLSEQATYAFSYDHSDRYDISIKNICFDCGGFECERGLNITCDSRFNIENITVKDFSVSSTTRQTGIYLATKEQGTISRHCYISNADILIYNQYAWGIHTNSTSADNCYSGIRIMGVNKGVVNTSTMLRITNVHIWGGLLSGYPTPDNWNSSAAIYATGITYAENLYVDTMSYLTELVGSGQCSTYVSNLLYYCGGTEARANYTTANGYVQYLTKGCNSQYRECLVDNALIYPNECYKGAGEYTNIQGLFVNSRIKLSNTIFQKTNLSNPIEALCDTCNTSITGNTFFASYPYSTSATVQIGTGYKICSLYCYNDCFSEFYLKVNNNLLKVLIPRFEDNSPASGFRVEILAGSMNGFDLYYNKQILERGYLINLYVIAKLSGSFPSVGINGAVSIGNGGLIDFNQISPNITYEDLYVDSTSGLTKIET